MAAGPDTPEQAGNGDTATGLPENVHANLTCMDHIHSDKVTSGTFSLHSVEVCRSDVRNRPSVIGSWTAFARLCLPRTQTALAGSSHMKQAKVSQRDAQRFLMFLHVCLLKHIAGQSLQLDAFHG